MWLLKAGWLVFLLARQQRFDLPTWIYFTGMLNCDYLSTTPSWEKVHNTTIQMTDKTIARSKGTWNMDTYFSQEFKSIGRVVSPKAESCHTKGEACSVQGFWRFTIVGQ